MCRFSVSQVVISEVFKIKFAWTVEDGENYLHIYISDAADTTFYDVFRIKAGSSFPRTI